MYFHYKRKHAEHAHISYVNKQGRVCSESEHNNKKVFIGNTNWVQRTWIWNRVDGLVNRIILDFFGSRYTPLSLVHQSRKNDFYVLVFTTRRSLQTSCSGEVSGRCMISQSLFNANNILRYCCDPSSRSSWSLKKKDLKPDNSKISQLKPRIRLICLYAYNNPCLI